MSFVDALLFVMEREGGFVNHPRDPGGATNFGITRGTLAIARGHPVTDADVEALSTEEATAIYRRLYWGPAQCEQMAPAVALMMFDSAVNQGVGRAKRLLQEALHVTVDGKIGAQTLGALYEASPRELVQEFAARRMVHYGTREGFKDFGLGWSRRLMATLTAALALT